MKTLFTKIMAVCFVLYGTPANAQWAMQSSGSSSNLFGVKFYDENFGFVVGWGNGGSDILRTTDGGKNWKKTAVPGTLLFSVDFTDQNTVYIAGYDVNCNCGLIKKSTDGGVTWNVQNDVLINETFGLYNVIMYGNKGYVSGYDGAIIRTENGWDAGYTVNNTGTSTEVFRVLEMTSNGNVGFAAGGSSFSIMEHLYRTTNGTDWQMIKDYSGDLSIGNLFFVNDKTGFMVGSDGLPVIMKTTDGGDNWTDKYHGTNDQLLVLDIGLASDAKTGYAITTAGEVLRTDDGGETWKSEQKIAGSPYLSALYVVNGNTAYAVGENGMIVKRSGSAAVEEIKSHEEEFNLTVNHLSDGSVDLILSASAGAEVNVSLFDIQGRLVEDKLPAKIIGEQTINIAGLNPGTYIVIAVGKKSMISRKFVTIP